MKVYLAHTLKTRYRVRDEIQPLLERVFDWKMSNPFLRGGRDHLFSTKKNKEVEIRKQLAPLGITPKMIVENDLVQIDECDALVVFMSYISIGSICELFYNAHLLERPTYVILDDEKPELVDLKHHPWLRHYADDIMLLSDIKACDN